MGTTIKVNGNQGVINTGSKSVNQVYNIDVDDINWEILNKDINILKSNSDLSIKKFAYEAGEVAQKRDKQGLFNILLKWIPCIADLISSSYYIIEIAKKFGIG